MDVAQGSVGVREMACLHDLGGKSFVEMLYERECAGNPLKQTAGSDTSVAQFFGERIYAAQTLCRSGGVRQVYFGMGHRPAAVKFFGLAKEQILRIGVICLLQGFDAVEPYHLHRGGAVGE